MTTVGEGLDPPSNVTRLKMFRFYRKSHKTQINYNSIIATFREGQDVKSNMVYRLCNNMVYTFALGSPSNRYAFLSV